MIKQLQQTVLALSLTAGISLSGYAQPPEDATGPHGPGPACAPPFEIGPVHGPMAGPMEHPGMMPELAPPPFLFGLDLNDVQQDKIFNIQLANAPLVRDQEKLARKAGRELHDLLEQDQYEEAKIKSLAETQAHALAQLEVLHARGMHQILAVLTAEQKTKLNAMKEKFAGPHHGEEH
jgi:Spy/CpxP family protein refolding chaperone